MSPYPSSSAFPPTPQSTPRNSSSSSALSTVASLQSPKGARFSANSNLMNYSIPKNEEEEEQAPFIDPKREIQRGDSSTRTRQLEAQIESLTLQNVKLQRTNRLLKIDTDNLIKQKTQPLEKTIRELTLANVQLQRATRLLQQELEEKTQSLERFKLEQITQMKSVGPEYEFLVQMVNLLHRQISGKPTCEETCCFTLEPIDQSNMVMTLPPEHEQQEMEAQHICRPVIHSSISQGSYAIELENKIMRLEQVIEELDAEKEQMMRQLSYKDNDIETLKRELGIKDEIVSQLEGDFLDLEEQLTRLQQELNKNSNNSRQAERQSKSAMHEERVQDPKRQSRMLMATKRRSLAIKDTDALERMLSGDLDGGLDDGRRRPTETDDESEVHDEDNDSLETDKDTIVTTPPRSASPQHSEEHLTEKTRNTRRRGISFLSGGVLPCAYPTQSGHSSDHEALPDKDPFAPFTLMTVFLGLTAQMGITDDWTVPITLAVLVSGFLWSGAAKGVQLKLKLNP